MSVTAATFLAGGATTQAALTALAEQIAADPIAADFVAVFYNVDHDDQAIHEFLRENFPGAALVGGTSGTGVMSDRGVDGPDTIGIFALADDDGRFGSAGVEFDDDMDQIADQAEQALRRALTEAGSDGELPDVIWVYQACGYEDMVLDGLRRVVADRCPIIGASAADDDESGRWRELGPGGPIGSGLAIAVLFPSGGVSFSFQGGFEPTGRAGTATDLGSGVVLEPYSRVATHRHIATIDGRPAAEVYGEWVRAEFPDSIGDTETLMERYSAQFAFGVEAGEAGSITNFRLVQPVGVCAAGGLVLAADIDEGAMIYAMRGWRDGLVRRAGLVAGAAIWQTRDTLSTLATGVAGALMVHCVDLRTALGDEIARTVDTVRERFGPAPFLSCFSAGEQGPALGKNVHANLMISAVVFGQ